ncbi:MAG TPA: penicillin-binding protein 2 [Coriobacteriia bacterium]|nr:penicillin-binding protein 2 [Coriobacteriia bacterium]
MSKKRSRPSGSGRYAFLLVCFGILFVLIGVRLVWIQGVKSRAYAEMAFNQRLRDIELPPRRGTIYDREGEPLAVSIEARTVFAAPNRIKDKAAVAKALVDTIGGDEAAYLEKLNKHTGFEYIARKVDVDRTDALEKLNLDGIGFLDDYRRLYPSGELACQVLGFVGIDDKGLAGVESEYNEVLGGIPGVLLSERDPKGQPIPGGVHKEIPPTHGHDVVLTIDKDIQYEAQVQISKATKKWGAKRGSVVIMSPRTGEIYAMASSPGFNPNQYGKAKAAAIRNTPISDAYEPGSTLKTLTASAVIEQGLYTPASVFHLPPTIRVGDRTIHESHPRGTVNWTLTEILTNSSNVGTVKLGQKLGKDGLYEGLAAFGLTEKTGVDFPGEAKGWLPEPANWSSSSIGNIPFGQGVSVTSLQLARAVAAVANDGELTTPHFLLDVPQDKSAVPTWPKRRAVTKGTAAQVNGMLQHVVTEGTGKEAAVDGYTVAGKTGTAQKAVPRLGYAGGKFVGSFIGFLPAEDPQVLVCVVLDEPSNAIYGGTIAAPTFSKLAAFSVSHLKVPPSSVEADSQGKTTETQGVGKASDQGSRD